MATNISAAYGAAAGSSPPTINIFNLSRDDSAKIFAGTGASGWTTGVYLTVTLAATYSGLDQGNSGTAASPPIPRVLWSVTYPSLAAAAWNLVLTSVTARQLVFSFVNAPNAAISTATLSSAIAIDFSVSP